MVSQFILLKSDNRIVNVASIKHVNFIPEKVDEAGEMDTDASLSIDIDSDENIDIEGNEAENIFLQLIKLLPNMIVVE